MNDSTPSIVRQPLWSAWPTRTDALTAGRGSGSAGTDRATSGQRASVEEIAREFEAMMTNQILRQMRQSELDGEDEGLGAETFTETTDAEFARLMARGSSLGLANAVRRALERQTGAEADDSSPGLSGLRGAQVTVRPAGCRPTVLQPADLHADPAVPLPFPGRVTSHFGWRQDPFGAGPRFHSGIDLAADCGREVDAVADGRVTFAGETPGYGRTVVIEHEGGASTRYAHLAAIDVRAGEPVVAGEIIGTVGQTGRSTGPHLHFELRQNGRPVDPEHAAIRLAGGLKHGVAAAD